MHVFQITFTFLHVLAVLAAMIVISGFIVWKDAKRKD